MTGVEVHSNKLVGARILAINDGVNKQKKKRSSIHIVVQGQLPYIYPY